MENSQAKSLAREAILSVPGHMVGECDSVYFEIEARMDSFAAVLTMLSCSSLYKPPVTNWKIYSQYVTSVTNSENN